jgi:hypothetical protein
MCQISQSIVREPTEDLMYENLEFSYKRSYKCVKFHQVPQVSMKYH